MDRGRVEGPEDPGAAAPAAGVVRGTRWLALLAGLVFLGGAVWKVADWHYHVEVLGAYGVLDFLPAGLLAAGSLVLEIALAVLMLLPRTWARGLQAAAAFLVFTAAILAWETLAGGGGDCGCLPFFTRYIGWGAVGQNLAAALFLGSLGVLGSMDGEPQGETKQPAGERDTGS